MKRPGTGGASVVKRHPGQRNSTWRVVLACFEIVGGILLLAGGAASDSSSASLLLNTRMDAMVAGVACLLAGVLLLSRPRWGAYASLAVQLLQVASVSGSASYAFTAGPLVRVTATERAAQLNGGFAGAFIATTTGGDAEPVGFTAQSGIWFGRGADAPWAIGINLVAVYFAWRLSQHIRHLHAARRPLHSARTEQAELPRPEQQGPPFDDDSRMLLEAARSSAEALHHQYIGAEHLLFAFIRNRELSASRALERLGVDLDALYVDILQQVPADTPTFNPNRIFPYTSRATQCLRLAVDAAKSRGLATVPPEFILLGMLREGRNIAAQSLVARGVTETAVRAELGRATDS